jgi:hypothetical protein
MLVQGDDVMVEKNARKEKAKARRVTNGFNTGERIHDDKRFPSRLEWKRKLIAEIEDYNENQIDER